MFKMRIAWKSQGLKAYFIQDGLIKPLLTNSCVNKWGTIYLLTDTEATKIEADSKLVEQIQIKIEEQRKLVDTILATKIHEMINNS